MSRKKRKSHKSVKLPEGLEKRLAVYALAAGAAGAALAATAQPARAEIISTTNIYVNSSKTVLSTNGHAVVFGTFQTSKGASFGSGFPFLGYLAGSRGLEVGTGFNSNPFVMVSGTGVPLLVKLGAGASIGTAGSFYFVGVAEGRTSQGSLFGNWTGTGPGYIGLRFGSINKDYFGWAKLSNSVTSNGGFHINVLEAAVNLTPNEAIKAGQTSVPEPSTLALLAMGAVGLFALRRKKLAGSN